MGIWTYSYWTLIFYIYQSMVNYPLHYFIAWIIIIGWFLSARIVWWYTTDASLISAYQTKIYLVQVIIWIIALIVTFYALSCALVIAIKQDTVMKRQAKLWEISIKLADIQILQWQLSQSLLLKQQSSNEEVINGFENLIKKYLWELKKAEKTLKVLTEELNSLK